MPGDFQGTKSFPEASNLQFRCNGIRPNYNPT